MNYSTKFNLGDHVWGISHHRFDRIVHCKPCGNTGKIQIDGEGLICPKCNGRSTHTQYAGEKFYVAEFDAVVGKISVEHVDSLYARWDSDEGRPNPKMTYMISNTGIGSGRVWDEDRLFSSMVDAQASCDRKNGTLPQDECKQGASVIGNFGEVLGVSA